MKLKKVFASLTAAALTCCMASAFTGVQAEESEKLRIMPLGDSITDGFNIVGGYRTPLWYMLEENGYTDGIDFVGPNWGGDGDPNHAGYSGYAIADIEGQRQGIYNFIDYLMENYPADVVMLQIGTNDILSSCTDGMADRLELLVDAVLSYLPNDGLLYLATIPYMDADVTNYTDAYTAEEMDAAVDAYNADVKALIAEKQAEGKQIELSDINSVLTKADLADGVHPSQDGYNKMANYWYGKIVDYLGGEVQHTEPQPTETTTKPVEEDEIEGALELGSLPYKTTYQVGETLDVTGLTVSLKEYHSSGFVSVVYDQVSPLEYKDYFYMVSNFDSQIPGTYTVTVGCMNSVMAAYRVTHSEVSFEVTVEGEASTEETADTTEESSTEPELKIGDVNHDRAISTTDVILLQKYLLGVEKLDSTYAYLADMNSDNVLDIFDLALLKRAVLNQ